ncbi:MAG TPA: hypothetical protein VJH23_01935 [archaeon]|nr:hypothetical protein [archaeon]
MKPRLPVIRNRIVKPRLARFALAAAILSGGIPLSRQIIEISRLERNSNAVHSANMAKEAELYFQDILDIRRGVTNSYPSRIASDLVRLKVKYPNAWVDILYRRIPEKSYAPAALDVKAMNEIMGVAERAYPLDGKSGYDECTVLSRLTSTISRLRSDVLVSKSADTWRQIRTDRKGLLKEKILLHGTNRGITQAHEAALDALIEMHNYKLEFDKKPKEERERILNFLQRLKEK